LATALADAGFVTAAFPDSSFLGSSSGLLGGFEIVADPPRTLISPARWHPWIRKPSEVADNFVSWVETLPADDRYFAWVHFSAPALEQLWQFTTDQGEEQGLARRQGKRIAARQKPPGAAETDEALALILEGLEKRGDLDRAMILVAGTQGDLTGGELGLAGQGFSVEPSAVHVPLVMAWRGAPELRSADSPVWSPDVAVTIAEAAGVELSDRAEGVSLTREVPENRVLFAWAWAPLDQMGWHAQRAARSGSILRVEGGDQTTRRLDDPSGAVPVDGAERLAGLLATRVEPAAPAVPLDKARPVLEARGLALSPVPSEGRSFGDVDTRRKASIDLLLARAMHGRQRYQVSDKAFERLLDLDPDNLGAILDFGQITYARDPKSAARMLGGALELYPTNPELLHWYAHAIWPESWEAAEDILELVLPFKPQDGDVLYDLACTRSLAGDLDESEVFLRRSIESGFRNFSHMDSDPDMRNMREDGRLSRVLKEYR
jgi:tetratricopeptide (TPR) repeat protein